MGPILDSRAGTSTDWFSTGQLIIPPSAFLGETFKQAGQLTEPLRIAALGTVFINSLMRLYSEDAPIASAELPVLD